jgi:hypothetical protein
LRKGIGLIALLLLAAALCGCKGSEEKEMLAYMEGKYREQFAMEGSYGGQLGKDYAMIQVKSRNRPRDLALVRISYKEEGNVYQDNYLGYLLREQIENKIKELAEEIYGECKVYYKIPQLVFPATFGPDMGADAFLRHPDSMVQIFIYPKEVDVSDKEEKLEALAEGFRKKGYFIRGVVSYPKEREMYDVLSGENFYRDGFSGYRAEAEAIFSMAEEGFKYLKWKGEKEE